MGEVIFRRIRGRLVPIRTDRENQKKKTYAQGVGLIAGGGALAGASEFAAGRLKAATLNKGAKFGQLSILRSHIGKAQAALGMPVTSIGGAVKAQKTYRNNLVAATKATNWLKGSGRAIGVTFASIGVGKIVNEATGNKDPGILEQAASGIVGTAIVIGGRKAFLSAFKAGIKKGPYGMKEGQLFFKGLK